MCGRIFLRPLLFSFVLLVVAACHDEPPILGKWKSPPVFGSSAIVEFLADKFIEGETAIPVTYKTKDDEVTVTTDSGKSFVVKVLSKDTIVINKTHLDRMSAVIDASH